MFRKLYIALSVIIYLTTAASSAYTYPQNDVQLDVSYFYQGDWPYNQLGCPDNDAVCRATRAERTISKYGCALTSMAMLYGTYGLGLIPDEDHRPLLTGTDPYLNPGTLNNYLAKSADPTLIFSKFGPATTRGFTSDYDIDWLKTTTNFFYIIDFIDNDLNIRPYRYVVPNYDCTPVNIGQEKRNGTVVMLKRASSCFRTDWSEGAMKRLDYDLDRLSPPIMKINYTKFVDGREIPNTHFVVIAGYDPAVGGDGGYRAYNPGIRDITWESPEPKALSGMTQYARQTRDGNGNLVNLYHFDRMETLYRFIPWWAMNQLDTSRLDITVHSPVEIQIIDPDGNLIGYDPDTGQTFLENPMSLYYEDTPVTSLDGTDDQAEPTKKLSIIQPRQGNYILNLFGTGDGPYTIDMVLTKSDGTFSLVTSFTGTATPGSSETYRITYSPTGEAVLSQTNQLPAANAGTNQTGEQSYEITLDATASTDPDGDPMTYTWSFVSKPDDSNASLSDSHASKPIFTPDVPGAYVLQLVVNDYFTDSVPSTVTITATPVKSRISVTPNFSQPLSSGSTTVLFDVRNIGRVNVSSGSIDVSLTDPEGVVVYNGTQAFSVGIGETKTIVVPATIPSLKFGNYLLTYQESDETGTENSATTTVQNSSIATLSLNQPYYRMRETADLTVTLTNTGNFNLDGISLTLSVPDAGFSDTKTLSLEGASSSEVLNYQVPVPATISSGIHPVDVTLTLPSGSAITYSTKLIVTISFLSLELTESTQVTAGDAVNVTIENTGGVDTEYSTEKVTTTDAKGVETNLTSFSGTLMVAERKTLTIPIPSQTMNGTVTLTVNAKDTKTGIVPPFSKKLNIIGLEAGLSVRTDKDIYLNTETISGLSTLINKAFDIDSGVMELKVKRYKAATAFSHFLPKTGWWPFDTPFATATGPDGSLYVAEYYDGIVYKFDASGKFITQWGSPGSDNGQFSWIGGIAVSSEGFVYVLDSGNYRVQKFDGDGNFILTWGSFGYGSSTSGKFYQPYGIVAAPDGSVYVADTYNHRIQKFDSSGNFIIKWGSKGTGIGQFNQPVGVTVSSDGYVFVVDSRNNRVQKFDSTGNFISSWGTYGSGDGQFNFPGGITCAFDGSLYVSDASNHRIQKFDGNGIFITKWGSQGGSNGQFYYPGGLSASSDGYVYVAETNNKRVQKFDADGNFISKQQGYGNGDGEFKAPHGVTTASDGSLYIADSDNDRIQKFDSDGNFTAEIGTQGSGDGQFFNPYSVAVSAKGSIYVADSKNHRIQKFDGSGNFVAKWGSYGNGDGQFAVPQGITVGPDGSIYVSDSNNSRIQKFDSNGNFLAKWGNYGSGDGQFSFPSSVFASADGSVYVADSGEHRVQKFDGNGSFIAKWGSYGNGDGQFIYPSGISASSGFVYVTDYYNNRVQKFDENGKFIETLGSAGAGDGQFNSPWGISIAPDGGSVYVADAGNHRVQKMDQSSSERLFKTDIPITQAADTTQEYVTEINNLNATGKLYYEATLKNSLGQTVANAEYPFYVVDGNTVLAYSTDKKIYKPGEPVTVTGEVKNLASITASGLNLALAVKAVGGSDQGLLTATFDLPADGSYPFTASTTAGSDGLYTLTGSVTQDSSLLAEISDQYQAATPAVSASMTGPDTVDRNPFTLYVQLANSGSISAAFQYTLSDSLGNAIDSQTIGLAAGETMLFDYSRQISQSTTYSVSLSGDVDQTSSKTVAFGESALITIDSADASSETSIYGEGYIGFPVTITNTGQVDETIEVRYTMQDTSNVSIQEESKSYFIPKSGTATDTLYYNLASGSYHLTASSSLPAASDQATITVAKENVVTMTTAAGNQDSNGLIPVTMNLVNNGYNDIDGTIALAVMDNEGKAVWRGEAQVSGLKSQSTANYTISVDSSGIQSGAYPATVDFYGSSGILLASDQTQIRVLGPIFEITSVPSNPLFTVGREASLNFTVKNTGTSQGTVGLYG